MSSEESYQGWLIRVVEEPGGYAFQCWILDRELSVSDRKLYSNREQALKAAKLRAKLESVRLSLTGFLHGKLQLLLLSPDEVTALENSISQFVDI
ncbi:MAG TPA: hypothetical protein V6C91_20655 [Coleofasciculaceae cyanobacterium]